MKKRGHGRNRCDLSLAILWILGLTIAFALMLAVLGQLLGGEPVTVETAAVPAPRISARSAVVMDLTSGRVLYAKNGDKKAYPASTTKIMTVLLGLEYGQLDQRVTVAKEAVGVEGSSIYLVHDEVISMKDLLYGALLRSGNEAATAIAAEIGGGSVDGFIALMNQRAKELGAEATQFTNPTGLFDEEHYTTAYDMALMARAAMQ
ncbi:MAG: D-alanyl-D-alanine carboxypeptidase, partial [Firmicutes bacterium]|nr:D-alanyl-D-alanine carboxypeptidase [Bacillota bacterium]